MTKTDMAEAEGFDWDVVLGNIQSAGLLADRGAAVTGAS